MRRLDFYKTVLYYANGGCSYPIDKKCIFDDKKIDLTSLKFSQTFIDYFNSANAYLKINVGKNYENVLHWLYADDYTPKTNVAYLGPMLFEYIMNIPTRYSAKVRKAVCKKYSRHEGIKKNFILFLPPLGGYMEAIDNPVKQFLQFNCDKQIYEWAEVLNNFINLNMPKKRKPFFISDKVEQYCKLNNINIIDFMKMSFVNLL